MLLREVYPVNADTDFPSDEKDWQAEREATFIKERLSKEVASWSKERRKQPKERGPRPNETAVERLRPVIQQHSSRPGGEPKKPSALPVAAKVGTARSFSMSYDGMTQAEYTQYLVNRGSR